MVFETGFGSNAKVVKYRLSPSEGEPQLYALTPRQVKALLSNTDYLGWMNRHSQLPYDITTLDKLEAWVSNLNLTLMNPVDICAHLIACIGTDEDVKTALREFLNGDETIRELIREISDDGTYIGSGANGETIVSSADKDALFGAVTFLVDTMHNANLDLYEAIENSSNSREVGQLLFAAIPLLETLPFDEMSEYVDLIVDNIAESYSGEFTLTPQTGVRDQIRCDLFCLAVDNDNSLSWEMIAEYFWSKVGYTITDYADMIYDFIAFMSTGVWTGDEIVYISFANVASVLSGAQKFADMTFPSLSGLMALGLNNPDPDWEILCLDCAPEPVENCLSFTTAYHGWQPDASDYGGRDSGGLKGILFVSDGKYYFRFRAPGTFSGTHSKIKLKFNQPIANIKLLQGTLVIGQVGATAASELVATELTRDPLVTFPFSNQVTWNIRVTGDTVPSSFRITDICTEPV